jgi:hypothetical protein
MVALPARKSDCHIQIEVCVRSVAVNVKQSRRVSLGPVSAVVRHYCRASSIHSAQCALFAIGSLQLPSSVHHHQQPAHEENG